MRTRRWVLFICLNITVSVLTTLGVLLAKGELERVVVVTATADVTPVVRAPTATPLSESAEPTASATSTSPAFIEYTVQPGDTLGGIALDFDVSVEDLALANNLTEVDVIQPDQVLIIPFGEIVTPTPVTPSPVPATATRVTPTPFPTETPTPPGPVEVRIQEVLAPGELEREGVVIVNRGWTVNLRGWTLGAAGKDSAYVFPRLTLAQEVPITVYTIAGEDSPRTLHWGQEAAQWGESGTVIELRDAEGGLIARYTVPE